MVTSQPSAVRLARVALGMPQSILAARTGVSQALISTIETGRRSLDGETAGRVAASLGCRAEDLLVGAVEVRVGKTLIAPPGERAFRHSPAASRGADGAQVARFEGAAGQGSSASS